MAGTPANAALTRSPSDWPARIGLPRSDSRVCLAGRLEVRSWWSQPLLGRGQSGPGVVLSRRRCVGAALGGVRSTAHWQGQPRRGGRGGSTTAAVPKALIATLSPAAPALWWAWACQVRTAALQDQGAGRGQVHDASRGGGLWSDSGWLFEADFLPGVDEWPTCSPGYVAHRCKHAPLLGRVLGDVREPQPVPVRSPEASSAAPRSWTRWPGSVLTQPLRRPGHPASRLSRRPRGVTLRPHQPPAA